MWLAAGTSKQTHLFTNPINLYSTKGYFLFFSPSPFVVALFSCPPLVSSSSATKNNNFCLLSHPLIHSSPPSSVLPCIANSLPCSDLYPLSRLTHSSLCVLFFTSLPTSTPSMCTLRFLSFASSRSQTHKTHAHCSQSRQLCSLSTPLQDVLETPYCPERPPSP